MSITNDSPLIAEPLRTIAVKAGRRWWLLLIPGILWIIVGFTVLRFDAASVAVIAVVLGITVLLAAIGEGLAAAITTGGWRAFHIGFGILLIIGAITVFADPGGSFLSLAFVIGFYFVFVGIYDVITSLLEIGSGGSWGLKLAAGLVELVIGFMASSSFASAAVLLVTFVSLAALFRGVAEISAAFSARRMARELL